MHTELPNIKYGLSLSLTFGNKRIFIGFMHTVRLCKYNCHCHHLKCAVSRRLIREQFLSNSLSLVTVCTHVLFSSVPGLFGCCTELRESHNSLRKTVVNGTLSIHTISIFFLLLLLNRLIYLTLSADDWFIILAPSISYIELRLV